jgi:hypothetical protein
MNELPQMIDNAMNIPQFNQPFFSVIENKTP